ncbi:MAG TPA: hypothetical protein V6D29_05230 [Leptolyngbyaceae cyanobacterium]
MWRDTESSWLCKADLANYAGCYGLKLKGALKLKRINRQQGKAKQGEHFDRKLCDRTHP